MKLKFGYRVLCLLALMMTLVGPGWGCDQSLKVWLPIMKQDVATDTTAYGLQDALAQCRQKMAKELNSVGLASAPLLVVGLFAPDGRFVSSPTGREAFLDALSTVWPAEIATWTPHPDLRLNDHERLQALAAMSPSALTVVVQVQGSNRESILSVDEVFFLWVGFRFLVRESVRLLVKAVDSHGNTVFLDSFEVSPTALADCIVTPLGAYLHRLEKRSSRPKAMFFECIKPGIHDLLIQEDFMPPTGFPPFHNLELPHPDVQMYYGPTVLPASPTATIPSP